MQGSLSTIIVFILYLALMVAIGLVFYSKSKNLSDYFLGGRNLNSWVTAISAQASDMSGWLLMGLPAAAYFSGVSASWIAIGLGLGTYLNWKIVASRLRRFTECYGDSITIPEYLENRFQSKSRALRSVCAVIIFIFFLIYTASAFNAGAKLFMYVFNTDNYLFALTLGSVIIVSYTFLGGFFAVCWTDLIQGLLMFFAIVAVPAIAMAHIPDFSLSTLTTIADGNFTNFFASPAGALSAVSIISSLAWGLGYFGMPHILTRFMAIKSEDMIKKSRLIAMIWVVVSLAAAVLVGMVGYVYLTYIGAGYESEAAAETVFMQLVGRLTPGVIAGVLLSAILAAVMSTADSQLLVTASAVTNDLYQPIFRRDATDKELMWVSRVTVIVVSVLAYLIAIDPENSVMGLVSYAWAGFGSAFGPVILFSLFWKRTTKNGAIAGMIAGGAVVLLWENLPVLASTGIYSIIPGFAVSTVMVLAFSLIDKEPGEEVLRLYETAAVKKH